MTARRVCEISDNKMPSITEWMQTIDYDKINAFRVEDNNKRDRLEILYQIINLPYDKPEKMMATDIRNKTKLFQKILKGRGDEKCALRLVPIAKDLPKLRVRGRTFKQNLSWFNKQKIDHGLYKVEVIPHNDDTIYSSIFTVNESAIQGEIVRGAHWQLTQGFFEHQPIRFRNNFKKWIFSSTADRGAIEIAQKAISYIRIKEHEKKRRLGKALNAKFNGKDYLMGYFEFVVYPDAGITYIDYNRRILANNFNDVSVVNNPGRCGITASKGRAIGKVRIVTNPANAKFKNGEILVCEMTTIGFVPLMQKAGAIITEQGNILSHPAIVSRELKKPCLVMVKGATKYLKNGDLVVVNATKGTVQRLS